MPHSIPIYRVMRKKHYNRIKLWHSHVATPESMQPTREENPSKQCYRFEWHSFVLPVALRLVCTALEQKSNKIEFRNREKKLRWESKFFYLWRGHISKSANKMNRIEANKNKKSRWRRSCPGGYLTASIKRISSFTLCTNDIRSLCILWIYSKIDTRDECVWCVQPYRIVRVFPFGFNLNVRYTHTHTVSRRLSREHSELVFQLFVDIVFVVVHICA